MKTILKPLQARPILLFTFVTILGLLSISLNVLAILWIDRQADAIATHSQILIELDEMQVYLLTEDVTKQEYLLTGDSAHLIRHKEYETLADFHLNQAQRLQTDEAEQALLEEIRRGRNEYQLNFVQIVALYNSGNIEEAIALCLGEGDAAVQEVHALMEQAVKESEATVNQQVARVESLLRWFMVLGVLAVLFFLAMGVLSFFASNRVMRPLILLSVFITLAVVSWNIYNLGRLSDEVDSIVHKNEIALEIEEVEIFLLEQEIAGLGYLLTGDEAYLQSHFALQEEIDNHFERAVSNQSSLEEASLLGAIGQDHDDYEALFEEIAAAYQSGNLEEATRLATVEANAILGDVQGRVDAFLANNQLRFAEELAQEALTVGIFTLIIFAVEAVVSTSVTSQVLTPVLLLIQAAQNIKDETYETGMLDNVAQRQDDIGQLARTFQEMSQTVFTRTQRLKQQVQQLRIQIDEAKSMGQVKEILDSDFFKGLETGAEQMRAKRVTRRQERTQKQNPT